MVKPIYEAFDYVMQLNRQDDVTINILPNKTTMKLFFVFTLVRVTKIKTAQGEIVTLPNPKTTSQPIRTCIILPAFVLSEPLVCEQIIRDRILGFNIVIERSICLEWAHSIVCYALDTTDRSNKSSFTVLARLVVAVRDVFDETDVLGRSKKEVFGVSDESVSCAVCLEEVSGGSECTRTPCSHVFHYGCMVSWLVKSNSCPICRGIVRDISV